MDELGWMGPQGTEEATRPILPQKPLHRTDNRTAKRLKAHHYLRKGAGRSSASTQDHRHAPLCCTGQHRGHISYVKVQIEVKPSCTVQCPLWLGFHVAGRVNSFENQS